MNNLLKILLAIFLPPVCAFIQVGFSLHFFNQHSADPDGRSAGHGACALAGGERQARLIPSAG